MSIIRTTKLFLRRLFMKQLNIVKKFFIIISVVYILYLGGCTVNYNYYTKDTESKQADQMAKNKSATWLTNATDSKGVEIKNTSLGRFWKVDFYTGHADNPETYDLKVGESFINNPRYLAFDGIVGYLNYYNFGSNGSFRSVYDGLEKRAKNALTPFNYDGFIYRFFEKVTSTDTNIDGKYHIYPSNLYIGIKITNDILIKTYIDNSTYNQFFDIVIVCIDTVSKKDGYMFEVQYGPLPIPTSNFKLSELLQSSVNEKLGSGYDAAEFMNALLNGYEVYVVIRNTRNDNISYLYNTDRNFCYRNVVKITSPEFK